MIAKAPQFLALCLSVFWNGEPVGFFSPLVGLKRSEECHDLTEWFPKTSTPRHLEQQW